ncbi:heavy metal-associated isoprenylated plant protein 41-like [Solanum stenotomum]|uniref:heavy metal-associated isoprenylated plant protein 41-like n=1 Tax=Solanum stenotomum TaxID=172797 RepID=UPI0020D1946A|nr:heavy metal-associated isoprenylated plant protein 41-like [Solanum stenotomum]
MAEVEENPKVINEEDEDEEEEKIIQHYSSSHQILLVGDGDFSFSLCLAQVFGSASNIVASSLQSYDDVIKMYKNGKSNLEKLKSLGGTVLHGVDATKIQLHFDLSNRKFDRIIYNFPHAGFHGSEDSTHLIQMHQDLVGPFLGSAKKMLRVDGQIHVTHKTCLPYGRWDLVGLGSGNSLMCIECADFKIENYPGYNNKRGAGSKCDEPFHLGECNTFKFIPNPSPKNVPRTKHKKRFLHAPSQNLQNIPNSISPSIYSFQQPLSWIDNRNSPTCVINGMNGFPSYAYQNFQKVPNSISPPIYSFRPSYVNDMNGFPSHVGLPARHDPISELFRIFKPYFSYIEKTFGRVDTNVEVSVRRALDHGAVIFRDETGRPPGDYLEALEGLHCWSRSRIQKLQQRFIEG